MITDIINMNETAWPGHMEEEKDSGQKLSTAVLEEGHGREDTRAW